MVKVYAVNIKDIEIDPDWLTFVSDHMRQRLYGILDALTYTQVLMGDLLIRFLAVKYLGVNNRDLLFETNEFGKPYLKTSNQPFYFNLSHSGHWVVCAVDQNPVGIDVQLMEPIDFDLAKNVLPPQSFQNYIKLAPEQRLDYFYDFWTRQESYLKLIGQGIPDFVVPSADPFENRYYQCYDLGPKYCLAVCSFSNQFETGLFYIEEVMDMIRGIIPIS